MPVGRREVTQYLRWLADQPDGILHRAWLFHAALLIDRDATTVFVDGQAVADAHEEDE